MTYSEAKTALEKLQGKQDASFSNAEKRKIEELYFEVLRKTFVHTSCQQCYHDAVIEMTLYLRKYRKLKAKCNYRMRAGFIISCPDFYSGKIFTNENLTDKVAKEYLERYPKQEIMFSEIPETELPEVKENPDGTPFTGSSDDGEGGEGGDDNADHEHGTDGDGNPSDNEPSKDGDSEDETPSNGGGADDNDDEDE